jgi:glycosyltransferase involved in cell wall biosynthesis
VRVAFLTSTPLSATEGSGTFVGIETLAAGLRAAGHRVRVRPLALRTGVHTLDRYLYNVAVALSPPADDLVVGFDLDGFLLPRRRAQPFVASLKGVIADELRNERGVVRALLSRQARWERLNTERADRVVVTSHYSAGVARTLYGVPPGKLVVVPEAIDLDDWGRWFAAAPRRPTDRLVVLSVARMYPRKRLADLLHAAALLRRRIPEVQVRIIGGGPERPRLRRLGEALGLSDVVVWRGAVSRAELAAEYVNADCFCLPSVQEGFGIVFLEAMAAGLAIVACRAAAVPEVVIDGESGLLVPPRSPRELAAALEAVLLSPGLRKDLAARGQGRAAEYARDRVAERFLQAIAR